MLVTEHTRTQLIGLSVAMLGQAPGTDLLNEWVADADGGMSVDDLANHIASTSGFQDKYPTFLTNKEFAEDFLGNLLVGLSDELMMGAVGLVEGLLNDGLSRGSLALAVVDALYDISMQGEDHSAYADLGMSAMAFANKIEVASHYTLTARMADPSGDAIADVTADADSVMMAIDAIDNPPAPPVEPETGKTFVLTPTIDNFMGGDMDDTFVAQPEQGASLVFQETLSPFDSVDGGGGTDTIYIYGVDPAGTLTLGSEDISNVENVVLNTVGAINADMSSWDGLESVDLRRFGSASDVTINVDGAMVSTDMTFGGDATIVGAAGAVSIKAGGTSTVHVGSAGHTESVTVMGGGNIMIDNGAGKHSQTVSSVSVARVAHNTGTETTEATGLYKALTDDDGFVVGQNGSTRVSLTRDTDNFARVSLASDGVTLQNATGATVGGIDAGDPITITVSVDHDGDGDGGTAEVDVAVQLKFNAESGGIVLGDIVGDLPTGSTIKADHFDGDAVPAGDIVLPEPSIGKEEADPETVMVGGGPTLTINSDAIADLTLASTTATILVHNNSMTADEKAMPEDLAITLNKYGTSKVTGKLCVAGAGSAENIMLTVAGDSWVDLNSNVVKMLDIDADAKLSLSVSKFNADGMPDGASETLAGVTVSGEGAVSMNSLAGMKKLASIDASGSSGNNSFMSDAHLAALATVMGGSGNDTVSLVADEDGKLESISTGAGNDRVSITSGDYREDGLMVDLGAGDDSFDGNAGNSMSRVDGGDGRDTLKLSADGATYKDADDKSVSIYSNFEVLDAGGGSGEYNVGRLGVDSIEIGETTGTGGVELDNVAAGTSLSVSSSRSAAGAATPTTATVEYNLAEDATSAGSLIGGGSNSILNVSLMAMGGKGDSKATQTGQASLTLTADSNLRGVIIDSNAGVHGTAAGKGASSGRYENTVVVSESSVEEVKITGNAQTNLSGAGLASLEYVNAAESGGGVTVNASVATSELTLIGSQQDDVLTAGSFEQTRTDRNTLLGNGGDDSLMAGAGGGALVGGAGADMLTGADGTDLFVINAASESQLSFKKGEDDDGNTTYTAEGYDTIESFTSGATGDTLHFSKALHAIVTAGEIVGDASISNGFKAADEWAGWMTVDTDGNPATTGAGNTTSTTSIDGNANMASLGADGAVGGGDDVPADGGAADLRSFIGNGKGLFLTSTTSDTTFGSTTRTYKNSIAVIEQEMGDAGTENDGDGIWLLFDIDGDGNFDSGTDMVIFIAGDAATFDPSNDISM